MNQSCWIRKYSFQKQKKRFGMTDCLAALPSSPFLSGTASHLADPHIAALLHQLIIEGTATGRPFSIKSDTLNLSCSFPADAQVLDAHYHVLITGTSQDLMIQAAPSDTVASLKEKIETKLLVRCGKRLSRWR